MDYAAGVTDGRQSLEPLRAKLRRVQLVMGLGFLAFVLGAFLSAPLLIRLQPRLLALDWELLAAVVAVWVSRVWVWGILPLLGYVAGRVVELKPKSSSVGAALTGELFVLGVSWVSGGVEGLFRGWLGLALHLLTLGVGIALCAWAIRRGRAAAERVQQGALQAAAAKTSDYAAFAAEAQRIAELNAQRAGAQTTAEAGKAQDKEQAEG